MSKRKRFLKVAGFILLVVLLVASVTGILITGAREKEQQRLREVAAVQKDLRQRGFIVESTWRRGSDIVADVRYGNNRCWARAVAADNQPLYVEVNVPNLPAGSETTPRRVDDPRAHPSDVGEHALPVATPYCYLKGGNG